MRQGGVVIAAMVVGLVVGASCSGDRQDGVFIDGAEVTSFCVSMATMEDDLFPALEHAFAPVNEYDQAGMAEDPLARVENLLERYERVGERLDAIDRSSYSLDPWADDAVATLLRSNRALVDDVTASLEELRDRPADAVALQASITDTASTFVDQVQRLIQSLETGYNTEAGVDFTLTELDSACNGADEENA